MAARLFAPQVTPTAAPMPASNFTPPAAAFGGGMQGGEQLAQGFGQLADSVSRIAQAEKAKDDMTAVRQADTALSDAIRERMYGKDGSGGFYGSKGQAAVDGYGQVGPDLDGVIKQLADRLGNDDQRRAFMISAEHRRTSELDTAARHTAVQRTKMMDDASDARVSSAILDGALRFNLDADRDAYYKTGGREIIDQGTRNGWAPDQTRLKLRQYASDFHSAAIARALDADPLYAQKLFDDNKTLLLPEQLTKMEAAVQQKTKLLQVDQIVAAARAAVPEAQPGGSGDAPSLDQRIVAAEGIERPGQPRSSTASGYGQFTNGTWLDTVRAAAPEVAQGKSEAEILALRQDKTFATRMVGALREKNAATLQASGVEATPRNLYLAHFLGGAGAARALTESDDTPVTLAVSQEARDANRAVFAKAQTVGQLKAWADGMIGGAGGGVSGGQPTLEQQLERIRTNPEIKDPWVRERAMERVEHEFEVQRKIKDEKARTTRDTIYKQVLQGTDPASISPDQQVEAGDEFMRRMRTSYAKGGAAPFNAVIESRLHELAIRDPAAFADPDKTDLTQYLGQHDRMTYWMEQQRKMATAESRAALRQPSYALGDRIAGELFPFTSKDKKAAESNPDDASNGFNRQARAKAAIRSWTDAYYDENKKAPTSDEVYRFGRSLGLQEKAWFSPGRRIDAVNAGTAATFVVDAGSKALPGLAQATGIPVGTLPQVVGYLKQRDIPVTYENLMKAYGAGTSGGARATPTPAAPSAPVPFDAGGSPSLSFRMPPAP